MGGGNATTSSNMNTNASVVSMTSNISSSSANMVISDGSSLTGPPMGKTVAPPGDQMHDTNSNMMDNTTISNMSNNMSLTNTYVSQVPSKQVHTQRNIPGQNMGPPKVVPNSSHLQQQSHSDHTPGKNISKQQPQGNFNQYVQPPQQYGTHNTSVSSSNAISRTTSQNGPGPQGHPPNANVGMNSNKPIINAMTQQQQANGPSNASQDQQKTSSQNPVSHGHQGQAPVNPPSSSTAGSGSGASTSNGGGGEQTISYSAERIIGNGSFGVVFQATEVETGSIVAIKKVLQDKRFKNRELQIMRQLVKQPHPNIVLLKQCFYSNGEKSDELYLNLVLEFVQETVYSVARSYSKAKQSLPILYVKLYIYQLGRALAHIHGLGICHRDIKPQNLLVDPQTHILKLCDFGSAKFLVKGEPNVAYICSRYYRAPELIFGSTHYTTAIDLWSEGCVAAELLMGQPLFPGESGVDQLVEIIRILGTPTREEIRAMNSNYTEFKFPQIKAQPWSKIFRSRVPTEAVDVVSKMLAYTPERRIKPLESCSHPFFHELRDPSITLPNGRNLPHTLFDFTEYEQRVMNSSRMPVSSGTSSTNFSSGGNNPSISGMKNPQQQVAPASQTSTSQNVTGTPIGSETQTSIQSFPPQSHPTQVPQGQLQSTQQRSSSETSSTQKQSSTSEIITPSNI